VYIPVLRDCAASGGRRNRPAQLNLKPKRGRPGERRSSGSRGRRTRRPQRSRDQKQRTQSYPEKFVAWGYPPWFSFVIGAFEIFAGMMLILPRRRFLGAAVMLFVLPGAIATHIINRDTLTDSIAAYAGSFFMFTGATASHIASGDVFIKWIGPVSVSVASWALRPAARRLKQPAPQARAEEDDHALSSGSLYADDFHSSGRPEP
jgi:uncharacterized membrane protein YphA (DoxX/SURF4 family)